MSEPDEPKPWPIPFHQFNGAIYIESGEVDRLVAAAREEERERHAPIVEFARWAAAYLEEPCRYDHHGYCQAHALDDRPCPMETIVAALADLGEGQCEHLSATGVDQTTGPEKVWRCDACGWLHLSVKRDDGTSVMIDARTLGEG